MIYILEDDESIRKLVIYALETQGFEAAGFENAGLYMIVGLVGLNFCVELAINLVLSTVIVQIINLGFKHKANN